HVTVVGHSYGSLVVARAAQARPGAVDDVVALGSPGLEVEQAADVAVPPGHVWVGAASGDPVSRLSWFGPDPAGAAFGARRFHAESAAGAPPLDQHSGYLRPGSESLAAAALVAMGAGGRLARAPGRTDHGYAGALSGLALL